MSFKKLIPAAASAALLLAVCSHDFNNPVDPINAPDNEVPVAGFVMTPNPANVRDTVYFDATSTTDDDDLDNLQARWDFDNDGNWELDWNSWDIRKQVTQIFLEAGTYKVVFEVQDQAGEIGHMEKQITVNVETAPFAYYTVSPRFGEPLTTTFSFDASGSRDETGATDLEYRWKFTKDQSTWDEAQLNNPVRQYTYAATDVGQQTVILQVRDKQKNTYATATVQFSVNVTAVLNRYPTAVFETSTVRGNVNAQITFDAGTSTDPEDGSNLEYRWGLGDGSGYTVWSATASIYQTSFSTPGARTIWLQVRDTGGNISTATLRITID